MLPDERLWFPHFLGLLSAPGIRGCWPARLAYAAVLSSESLPSLQRPQRCVLVCDWIHIGNYFLFLFCPEETLKRTEPNGDGSCGCELTCDRHGLSVEFSGMEALDDRMSQISPPNTARPQGRKWLLGWHQLLSGTPRPSDISNTICYLTGKRD